MEKKIHPIKIQASAEHVATFDSFNGWVNYAYKLRGFGERNILICLDKNGNLCHIGEDFMAARDANLFPVTAYRLIRTIETIPSPTSSGE